MRKKQIKSFGKNYNSRKFFQKNITFKKQANCKVLVKVTTVAQWKNPTIVIQKLGVSSPAADGGNLATGDILKKVSINETHEVAGLVS